MFCRSFSNPPVTTGGPSTTRLGCWRSARKWRRTRTRRATRSRAPMSRSRSGCRARGARFGWRCRCGPGSCRCRRWAWGGGVSTSPSRAGGLGRWRWRARGTREDDGAVDAGFDTTTVVFRDEPEPDHRVVRPEWTNTTHGSVGRVGVGGASGEQKLGAERSAPSSAEWRNCAGLCCVVERRTRETRVGADLRSAATRRAVERSASAAERGLCGVVAAGGAFRYFPIQVGKAVLGSCCVEGEVLDWVWDGWCLLCRTTSCGLELGINRGGGEKQQGKS